MIEIQKVVGAVLFALLLFALINVGYDAIFPEAAIEATVYPVAAGEGEAGTAAAVEEEEAAAVEEEKPTAAEVEPASPFAAMLATADPGNGRKLARKCAACHDFAEGGRNKLGPALWGIVGAAVASRDGYKYSRALSGLGGQWGYDALDAFLAAPKSFVPGTKMAFAGVKDAARRADLVAYLRSLAADPAALPAE